MQAVAADVGDEKVVEHVDVECATPDKAHHPTQFGTGRKKGFFAHKEGEYKQQTCISNYCATDYNISQGHGVFEIFIEIQQQATDKGENHDGAESIIFYAAHKQPAVFMA